MGSNIAGNALSFFGGQTSPDMASQTQRGLQQFSDLGREGDQGTRQAIGYNQDVLAGKYLRGGPELDAEFNRAAEGVTRQYQTAVAPQVGGAFGRSGRYQSGGRLNAQDTAQRGLGDTLANLGTDISGGNRRAERGEMGRAAQAMPALYASRYAGAGQQIGAGARREAYDQSRITEARDRFEFGQMEPWKRAGMFQGLIGGPVTESSSEGRGSSSGMNVGLWG